jgi:Ran GTPase-activating protein (RanGAP) involved in mRNA processing and transport
LTDEGFDLFVDDLIECIEYRNEEHPDGIVRLVELHLQGNRLAACSLKKLARVISLSAGDLKELDLSDNLIEIQQPEHREIWQDFLQSFERCYVLKKLDLSRNPLGPRGAEILARVYMQSELDFWNLMQMSQRWTQSRTRSLTRKFTP